MNIIHIARYGVLGTILLFSLINLGISGNLISHLNGAPAPASFALDLAVAVITMVIVIPCLIIDFLRKDAFTSMVAVEIGWSALLTILWVAAAGETTALQALTLNDDCNIGDRFRIHNAQIDAAESFCHQRHAIEAFAWLGFILFLGWLATLIAFAAIAHSRGNSKVWTSSVTGTDFFARAGPTPQNQMPYNPQPMQQQQQYPGYSSYPPAQGYNQSPQGYTPSPPPQGYSPSPQGNPFNAGAAHV